MSWIRTAVSRAVEGGKKNNLKDTVWSVADSVVLGGAKMIHDRIATRNMQNLRITVKRLEEASVSCKGDERVQLLRRWLAALKEIDRLFNDQNNKKDISDDTTTTTNNNNFIITKDDNNSDSSDTIANDNYKNNVDQFSYEKIKDSTQKPTLVYYYDPEIGEPMNFREVFLYSQALEGMALSMILEAPNEEEVSLFMEILRTCIEGGKEDHETVMRNIVNLAMTLSNYQEEVLIKREELLQYAKAAIKGIKINVGLARIDAEACSLKEKLGDMEALQSSSSEGHGEFSEKHNAAMIEALKEALGVIRLYSRLEALLIKKKSLSNGDTPELHAEKVDKLKVLSESLVNSTSKAERRISEQRVQKEEAISFRLAKADEVSQQEKELEVWIVDLEKQKIELEAELRKVNASIVAARVRLRNAREERDQFDDASNQILSQLALKEEEISKSIALCRVEADVVNVWIHFLEDTWLHQTTYLEQKEKQINGELQRYGESFVNLVTRHLTAYKEQLTPALTRIRQLVENLTLAERSGEAAKDQRRTFEEEYLSLESKFVSTFSVVGSMKSQIYSPNEGSYRKKDEKLEELFDELESIREAFESIERPTLDLENPILISQAQAQAKAQAQLQAQAQAQSSGKLPLTTWSRLRYSLKKRDQGDPRRLKFEWEQDDEEGLEDETDEIVEWEYDAFEKDFMLN